MVTTISMEGMKGKENMAESKVERERKRALEKVLNEIDARFEAMKKPAFKARGREFPLTCGVDCMVSHSQTLHHAADSLYSEIVKKGDYREEQAIAKLMRLFESHAKTMALFAELKEYYPEAAKRVEGYIPALGTSVEHGEIMWGERKQ